MIEGKKILVTGGAGYIGSACVAALAEQGHSVVVIDNLSKGQADKIHPNAIFVKGDITDADFLRSVFDAHEFESVIHLAALKSPTESEVDPGAYFHVNVTGTLNLLAVMSAFKVPNLIFSSTAAVYESVSTETKSNEDAHVSPLNVYGYSKLLAEVAIKEYVRTGKLNRYSILRYFNVTGDVGLNYREKDAKSVFPILAQAINNAGTFNIFGTDYPTKDGTCIRDYIHLHDLVAAHLALLSHDQSGTYNVGTSHGYSVRDIINVFETVSGKKLLVEEKPRRPDEIIVSIADSSKAKLELGWEPTRTLSDMVESTLAVYSKHA